MPGNRHTNHATRSDHQTAATQTGKLRHYLSEAICEAAVAFMGIVQPAIMPSGEKLWHMLGKLFR